MMNLEKVTQPTQSAPCVYFEIDGNLHVRGWEQENISATAPHGSRLTIDEKEDGFHIYCDHDCHVRLPIHAEIHLTSVDGHGDIRDLSGALFGELIESHLVLKRVTSVQIEKVEGHFHADQVSGSIQIGLIEGHCHLQNVHGAIMVREPVEGHVIVEDVLGDFQIQAQGHLRLNLDLQPGQSGQASADGNLRCILSPEADVEIQVEKAERLRVRLPGVETTDEQIPYVLTLGEGNSHLRLASGGGCVLQSTLTFAEPQPSEDWSAFGERIAERMGRLGEEMGSRFGAMGPEIAERVQARIEAKISEVERKMSRAERHIEHRFDHLGVHVHRRMERPSRPARPSRRPRPAPRQPVDPEEQTLILQMLAEGKISSEEADQLLRALEGQF